MAMFKHLRTKLTVLYAALLGVGLIVLSVVVYSAIATNAERLVRKELEASATVFDRLWAMRARQFQDTAAVLSRDFGFREAVATNDEATVQSALANLSGRLGLDLALIVGIDGHITTADGRRLGSAAADLIKGAEGEDGPSGVLLIDNVPYQAVSAPILSPMLTGWVVFGAKLEGEIDSLEKYSAIPLDAAVLNRRPGANWTTTTGGFDARETQAAGLFIDEILAGRAPPSELASTEGRAIAMARPLQAVSDEAPFVLMLRYPLARAMAPYGPVINVVLVTMLITAGALVAGSWAVARGVTQPISALDEAAHNLARGEDASVDVTTGDEIGRLAVSFNTMAAEIRERERRLAGALERAESANRLTGEFLANMSHEMRTPLNGVLGLSQVLQRTSQDPANRELVNAIIASASGLERLLCDILEAAQLRAGAAELHPEPFALAPALESAVAPWRAAAHEKGLGFMLEIAPAADVIALGDVSRLKQVLNALLGNAVKFTSEGEIGLRLLDRPVGFRFEVLDTGAGVDPSQKEQMFAAFRQADGSSTRRHGGAGLGLNVALGLVELMGGTLDCAPRPGGGSVFTVDLPLERVVPGSFRAVA
jgi:signal transduction histidine kinase